MINRTGLYLSLISFALIVMGCHAKPLPYVPPSEAREHLISLLESDYELMPVVRQIGQTVWIYTPIKESMYKLEASKSKEAKVDLQKVRQEIKFLEGHFKDKSFYVEYDVDLNRYYVRAQTFKYAPSEQFAKAQRAVFSAIKQSYPLKDQNVPDGETAADEEYPDFFVLMFADIENGLEYGMILNLDDYHRSSHDPGFTEEYQKRIVQIPFEGNPEVVGDETGKHLKFEEITWPRFLNDQALQRIRHKYGTSAFEPTTDTEKEFLQQFAITVSAYGFEDFESIHLVNIFTKNETVTDRDKLYNSFPLYEDKPEGKLHTIKFDDFGNITEDHIQ